MLILILRKICLLIFLITNLKLLQYRNIKKMKISKGIFHIIYKPRSVTNLIQGYIPYPSFLITNLK